MFSLKVLVQIFLFVFFGLSLIFLDFEEVFDLINHHEHFYSQEETRPHPSDLHTYLRRMLNLNNGSKENSNVVISKFEQCGITTNPDIAKEDFLGELNLLYYAPRKDYDICSELPETENCGIIPYFRSGLKSHHPALCTTVLSTPLFPASVRSVDDQMCTLLNYSRTKFQQCLSVKSYLKRILFIGDSRLRDKFHVFCNLYGSGNITGGVARMKGRSGRMHRNFCCDTDKLQIRLMWLMKYEEPGFTKLVHLLKTPSVVASSVVITSTCLWYGRNYSIASSYQKAIELFENYLATDVLFLSPDGVFALANLPQGRVMDERRCEGAFREVVWASNVSHVHGMAGQRMMTERYGTVDGKHMTQEGNMWTVQRILNWLCNKVMREHFRRFPPDKKICCN